MSIDKQTAKFDNKGEGEMLQYTDQIKRESRFEVCPFEINHKIRQVVYRLLAFSHLLASGIQLARKPFEFGRDRMSLHIQVMFIGSDVP